MEEKSKTSFVHLSMERPFSVVVVAISVVLLAFFALSRMSRDILPNLGVPIIYVAQPYGGLDPSQMESYLTYYYEYHFLYLTGIEHVESKNIQSVALIKLQFHPGTDMAQAMAETINYVNRAKAFMPPGTLPPFVMRFDAGSEPVGSLVFSSSGRSVGELQNLALNQVRPLFATLPGVSAPPPFGSSQRTVVIRVDPKRLERFNLSPFDVAEAVAAANKIVPSGNILVGDQYPIVPLNSVVKDIKELDNVPLRVGTSPTVFLKDVATVADGTDIQTGYALVNGHRTVYIPVTKRADASTLTVVNLVKKNLPRFQSVLPEDVKVSYEFDQSGSVRRAIRSLFVEGLLGALLTSLMVLFFLGDWRSAAIVVINIPLALGLAVTGLWLSNQTLNIMTLGGLALAIGILVDETTVTIENIHSHSGRRKSLARSAIDATNEILKPCLLTMLCVLAVFIPSFFMAGVSRALFVPLTLAVGFSIVGSFLFSRTLVPVLATLFLRGKKIEHEESHFKKFQANYKSVVQGLFEHTKSTVFLYVAGTAAIIFFIGSHLGLEIFPSVDLGQFQFRLREPAGTALAKTESVTLKALDIIKNEVGEDNVEGSLGFVGTQPPNYPINAIYLWSAGPEESVLQVALKREAHLSIDAVKERLRERFAKDLPETEVTFEATGIIDHSLSQGASSPIQIAINGKDIAASRAFAETVKTELAAIPALRDIHFGQVFNYPSIDVKVDRRKAGLMGLTMDMVGRALVPATSSSRYLLQNYWSDPKNGINYQVQIQVPEDKISSLRDLAEVPVSFGIGAFPLGKVAELKPGTVAGEFDRYNMQRMVTLSANIYGKDLGSVGRQISRAIEPLRAKLPKGMELNILGQMKTMGEMFNGLLLGLLTAIIVIFLVLTMNFQSVLLSFVVLSTIPATIAGVVTALQLTGTTLNLESFMGAIMAIGVAVSNAILLVTFAERSRISHGDSARAALEGSTSRLRPILMTSIAMIAGMIPMALGLGDGGQQSAPLGRAVIGGLAGATLATLFVLPNIFCWVQKGRNVRSGSLNPDDPKSSLYEGTQIKKYEENLDFNSSTAS